MKKALIFSLLFCFIFIASASAIQITTFNNSLSSENITINANGTATRYIEFPSRFSTILTSSLSLIGLNRTGTEIKLITYFNITTNQTGNTSRNFFNKYFNSPSSNITFDDFEDGTINASLWSTFTCGTGAIVETGGEMRLNLTGGSGCQQATLNSTFNLSNVDRYHIQIDSFVGTGGNAIWFLTNGTATHNMKLISNSIGSNGLAWVNREGSNISYQYPGDAQGSVDVSNWGNTINFAFQVGGGDAGLRSINLEYINRTLYDVSNTQFSTINNFNEYLQSYIDSCTADPCKVPVNFFSATNGTIQYTTLSIEYGQIYFNNIIFNATTIETSNEGFVLNTTLNGSSLSSATLVYNNTRYTSTKLNQGSNTLFQNNISIPSVTTAINKSFYWEVIVDGSVFNSSFNNQTINPLLLGLCDVNKTIQVLNFTSYLEKNLTRVNPFSFQGTFDYYVGSGTTFKTESIQNNSAAEVVVCVSNIDIPVKTNAHISYGFEDANLSLVSRNYFFDDATLINATQNISLLLLEDEDATSFILKVIDGENNPVENAFINIQRYYPGEGIYRTVQIAKTDDNGRSVGFYQTETVTYKHIITKDGIVLLDTGEGGVVVGESVPFTLTFTVGDDLIAPWEYLNENSTILTSLAYNDTSKLVSFGYIDPSGSTNFGRLYVYQEGLQNSTSTTICDTNTTGSAATITCNMTGLTGTYIAKGYVIESTNLQKLISFIITTARDVFGQTGVFLGWIILLTVSMAMLFNPSVGIIVIDATIIFLGLTGLLIFSPVAYFAIIGISILLLILFKT